MKVTKEYIESMGNANIKCGDSEVWKHWLNYDSFNLAVEAYNKIISDIDNKENYDYMIVSFGSKTWAIYISIIENKFNMEEDLT